MGAKEDFNDECTPKLCCSISVDVVAAILVTACEAAPLEMGSGETGSGLAPSTRQKLEVFEGAVGWDGLDVWYTQGPTLEATAVQETYPPSTIVDPVVGKQVYVGLLPIHDNHRATYVSTHDPWFFISRASFLSATRANYPDYPNIASVDPVDLFSIQSLLPRLSFTNGHASIPTLVGVAQNSQCDSTTQCWLSIRNLLSSVAGTADERSQVASSLGISSSFAGVLNDFGVLLVNWTDSFTTTDVTSIRQVLSQGYLPLQIVEMINTIVSLTPSGVLGSSGIGTVAMEWHEENPITGSTRAQLTMPGGTVIYGHRLFDDILLHEIGHLVDSQSPEHGWRYEWLYNKGKGDPNAVIINEVDSQEDFVWFWNLWQMDSLAALQQVQSRNNPVFSCKVAHIVDLLSYDSDSSVPYYKAATDSNPATGVVRGDPQRLGTLPVTRTTDLSHHFSAGTITAINGVPITCPKHTKGDVDGDGYADLMLVGGAGWAKTPVGFSNGNAATYRLTERAIQDFGTWAQGANVTPVAGDFNNDGRWDLALVGGSGMTIPVAFSNGDGSFGDGNGGTVPTNYAQGYFEQLAAQPGVKPVVADFDGDGKSDIALLGGAGWNMIPIAFSMGNGSFNVSFDTKDNFPSDDPNEDFPGWAATSNVQIITGDFAGGGLGGIALTGPAGWNTIPVAYSMGQGTFWVYNRTSATFAGLASTSGVQAVGGDFNGDGRTDIALVGVSGWQSIPIAFSTNENVGQFTITNVTNAAAQQLNTFAAQGGAKVVSGDVDGDGKDDLIIAGGSGVTGVVTGRSVGDGTFVVTNSTGGNNTAFATDAKVIGVKMLSLTRSRPSPCSSFCAPPVPFTWSGSYQSGNLGTGTICRETVHPVAGGNCGSFASGRTLSVNGTQMTCNNLNWTSIPAPVNGGYCVTTTAGNYSWAFFTLW